MDLREQIRRHRKDARFLFGGLGALLFVLTVFYYLLLRGRGLPQPLLANRVLLFALWYVNILLILVVLFILVRSFFRLLLERQHRILGSKFKTKLVLTSIALSLIPVLILFPFATRLLVDSFDRWFGLPIDQLMDQAATTADALSDQIESTNLRDAQRVAESMAAFDLDDLEQRPALQRRLLELREELQLDYLALYDEAELIHGTADARTVSRDPDLRGLDRFLGEALSDGQAVRIEESLDVDGRLILAAVSADRAAPADASEGPPAPRHTVAVAGTVLPPDLAEQSEALKRSYQQYLQWATQQEELRTLYLQILLMVTLLVVLAFSSMGLRLARRVTTPIQALAEGTRRLRAGQLGHRVEVAVDDELGVLVDGFNRMSEELEQNRDLVEQRTRELEGANRRIAAVLQNVAAGVVSIDGDGRIATCNGAALSILHQSEEQVIGHPHDEVWTDPERSKLVQLLADSRGQRAVEAQLRLTVGGVWKTLEVKATTLPDAGGRPGGLVVVLEDLTELIRAQELATWNEVARRIAHEIKNPLTPIKLTAERLLRKHRQGDPDLGQKLEEGAAIIVREVATLKSLVDEFSRFARMPQPQPRDLDLETVVGETLPLYRGLKPGVEVEADVRDDARRARFDPEQLRNVLVNLIDNAIEATEAPGRVVVSTTRRNGRVLLHVADTGRGIPPEDREKLFLPYFSTKGRGTGLGLSIVHRIVTDNRGAIRVEDNHPHGTVFTVEIPRE